ncbi:uncharacterized protein JCM15063_002442 [Sporobolomyces koalae]|uniref:uncharacterized protein n=1 Tax=Sporobolomyces koalae TaxID=500713 RepID=UPI00317D24C2
MTSNDPNLYASAFAQSRSPPASFHPISLRISLQRALTRDLAAYSHERQLVEDQYLKSLERLASRAEPAVWSHLDAFNLSPIDLASHLGPSLEAVRQQLTRELEQTAAIHRDWIKKHHNQVQVALERQLDSPAWTEWNQADRELARSVTEYEALVDKLSKAQSKATKSSKPSTKLLSTQSSLSSIGSRLVESLPAFLTESQQLEQDHLTFVKEALVKAGTFTADLGRDRMELGEQLVVKTLAIDGPVESQEWALREGQKASASSNAPAFDAGEFGLASTTRRREDSTLADTASIRTANTSTTTTTNNNNNPGNRNPLEVDPGYQRERTASRMSTLPPPVAPLSLPTSPAIDPESDEAPRSKVTKSKSTFGGKLSSFLGGGKKDKNRDRSSSIPNSARYSTFGSGSAPPLPTAAAAPITSSPLTNSERDNADGNAQRPARIDRSNSGGSDLLGGGPGSTHEFDQFQHRPLTPTQPGTIARPGGVAGTRTDSTLDESGNASRTGGVDSEGFSVPPVGYDRAIGASAGGIESGAARNLMDDEDDEEGDNRPLRSDLPKLNILPIPLSTTTSSTSSPIIPSQESEQERLKALESIKNSLGLPTPASGGAGGGLNRRSTARGRRSEVPSIGVNNRHSMLPSAIGSRASPTLGNSTNGQFPTSAANLNDDDVPLATIQQQQQQQGSEPGVSRRRAAPPPPPLSTSSASPSSTIALPPVVQPQQTQSPTLSSFNPRDTAPASTKAMSILSNESSAIGGGGSVSGFGGLGGGSNGNVRTTADRRGVELFAGVVDPGVRFSVVEQVHVLIKQGQVQKVLVTGHISCHYTPPPSTSTPERESIRTVRLGNLERVDKLVPNPAFVKTNHDDRERGEYELDLEAVQTQNDRQTTTASVPIFKYQLSSNSNSVRDCVPVLIKPVWRCEPNLTRIIVTYSKNPQFSPIRSTGSSASPFGEQDEDDEDEIEGLKLEIPFAPSSTRIRSFQSKPAEIGRQLASSNSLEFSLPFGNGNGANLVEEQKLLVSVQTEGTTAQAQPMSLEWTLSNRSFANVSIEGVDEIRTELVSGKYIVA